MAPITIIVLQQTSSPGAVELHKDQSLVYHHHIIIPPVGCLGRMVLYNKGLVDVMNGQLNRSAFRGSSLLNDELVSSSHMRET